MKARWLSSAAGLLLCVLATIWLRNLKRNNRVQVLGILFVAVFLMLIFVHLLTPPDLGFLSNEAMLGNSGLDLFFATFLYSSGFSEAYCKSTISPTVGFRSEC